MSAAVSLSAFAGLRFGGRRALVKGAQITLATRSAHPLEIACAAIGTVRLLPSDTLRLMTGSALMLDSGWTAA